MGLIDKLPKLAIVQSEGCAPMAAAWRFKLEKADPVVPRTRIAVLATGDPGQAYTLAARGLPGKRRHDDFGARMVTPSARCGAWRASRGMSMEPAAAVAFAGLERLIKDKVIGPDDRVVVNCSGHTFPAEKHILEDQYVLDLQFGEDDTQRQSPAA